MWSQTAHSFFLVRASKNRCVVNDDVPSSRDKNVFGDVLRNDMITGRYKFEVSASNGKQSRRADVEVSFFRDTLMHPQGRVDLKSLS